MRYVSRRTFTAAAAAALTTGPVAAGQTFGQEFKSRSLIKAGTNPFSNAKPYRFQECEIRTRPTWNTADLDATTRILAGAYKQMVLTDDPTQPYKVSLARQAWLHDYICSNDKLHGDIHSTWLFLPWHRGFVYFHEKMLRAQNPDFRLPAWDWSNENGRAWPDFYGSFDPRKLITPPIPENTFLLPKETELSAPINECILQGWMVSNSYADFLGTPNQKGGAYWGPHAYVHANIGGILADPTTAALDPLFYTHHCNLDRFFAKWWMNYPELRPSSRDWLDAKLYFYDVDGSVVSVCVQDLLDTEQLGYSYDLPNVALYRPAALRIDFRNGALKGFNAKDIQDFLNVTSLSLSYMTLAADKLIPFLSSSSALLRPFWEAGENGAKQLLTLLSPVLEALPFKIQFKPGKMLASGFYVFGLSKNSAQTADPLPAMGGFGIFTEHDSEMVTGTICLQAAHVAYIVAAGSEVSLGYGIPRDKSVYPDQRFDVIDQVVTSKFLYPQDPTEFARIFGSALKQIPMSASRLPFRF